jgi:uncharacterized membrane protein YqhA
MPETIARLHLEALMNLSTTQLRMLGSVMYFAAFSLFVSFFADLVIKVWPIKLSELNWRVGAAGLVMEVLLASVVPLAIFYFAAFMNNDRKTLQFMRWLTVAVGVIAIGLLGLFALDAVQIRAQLPQNVKAQFIKAALKASLQGVLSATLFIWFGLTVGKVMKSAGVARGVDTKDGMLMVGSREASPSRPNLRAIDPNDSKKKDGAASLSIDS